MNLVLLETACWLAAAAGVGAVIGFWLGHALGSSHPVDGGRRRR